MQQFSCQRHFFHNATTIILFLSALTQSKYWLFQQNIAASDANQSNYIELKFKFTLSPHGKKITVLKMFGLLCQNLIQNLLDFDFVLVFILKKILSKIVD